MADRKLRKMNGGSLLGNDWENRQRLKIQSSNVCNKLIQFVDGQISMSREQASVAIALLRKVLPDLISADGKLELTHRYVIEVPASLSADEWQKKYSQPLLIDHDDDKLMQ